MINIDSIRSIAALYSKVMEHEKALIYASHMETSHPVIAENLLYNLRRIGISPSVGTTTRKQDFPSRQANMGKTPGLSGDTTIANANAEPEEVIHLETPSSDDFLLKEAYQILKQRQRAPPKGGYPFPKNDHIMTKLGHTPPSPCKVCGSKNHWDKECPDWNTFLETWKHSVNGAFSADLDTEEEMRYMSAYSILLNSRIAEHISNPDETSLPQGFEGAAREAFNAMMHMESRRKTDYEVPRKERSQRATVEEVEDEDEIRLRNRPIAPEGILLEEVTDEDSELPREDRTAFWTKKVPPCSLSIDPEGDRSTQDKSPPIPTNHAPANQARV